MPRESAGKQNEPQELASGEVMAAETLDTPHTTHQFRQAGATPHFL